MALFNKKAPEIIKIDAEMASNFEVNSYMVGKLHSYIPTKNESGFMLEIHLKDEDITYSVLTYAKKSAAYLSTQLGGRIGLTFTGVENGYANFQPKFLAAFKNED